MLFGIKGVFLLLYGSGAVYIFRWFIVGVVVNMRFLEVLIWGKLIFIENRDIVMKF